jgi:polar amino acid transport system substrate-binding protein
MSSPHSHCSEWFVVFGCILYSLSGLSGNLALADGQTLERLHQGETITLAIANEAPFGYIDATGAITGEAPQIARVVLERIAPDHVIDWVSTDFGSLISGLKNHDFDIVAAGMFITPERCREVAFSNPTYVVGEAFIVHADNPLEIRDYWSIADNEAVRVGLMVGAVQYNYALVTGTPAHRARLYPDYPTAIEALRSGEIDAIGMTALTAASLLEEHRDLAATEQFFPELDGQLVRGYGAFAFRPQDHALADAFDAELAQFIGSEEHQAIVEPFGFGPDMQPDRDSIDLCTP